MSEDRYEDIMGHQYKGVVNHDRMSLSARGAQFAPFAALTGHDAAIRETARLTDMRMEQSEDVLKELQEKFFRLLPEGRGAAVLTYFRRDMIKAGGEYVSESVVVKKVDDVCREFILRDGRSISFDDILDITDA
ncbi:MAG: hypothetical protein K2L96_04400 [Muribaculaceae bacterium]|nr:hypothetical protein [Muribaculaceae bacterium]